MEEVTGPWVLALDLGLGLDLAWTGLVVEARSQGPARLPLKPVPCRRS